MAADDLVRIEFRHIMHMKLNYQWQGSGFIWLRSRLYVEFDLLVTVNLFLNLNPIAG